MALSGRLVYRPRRMNTEVLAQAPRQRFLGQLLFVAGLWIWAIWACAEHWEGNPNYSYGWAVPVLALFFAIRRYLLVPKNEPSGGGFSAPPVTWYAGAAGLAVLIFLLEYGREEMWHQQFVLWSICLLAVATSILVAWRYGGLALAKAEAFPAAFFLTAVPWPPRFEQPITAGLMRWVAAVTTEILHWLGIEAQSAGGAIALRTGLVGITEACSGIRSLQAGVMFGLAMGEWFLLRPARRVVLLVAAIVLALLTNLGRTLALALQAEKHGAESIDKVHDLIGNITITSLVLAIWVLGKILSDKNPLALPEGWLDRLGDLRRKIFSPVSAPFTALVAALLLGVFSAHFVYARRATQDQTQTRAYFSARTDAGSNNRLAPVPREVWNELRPTSGEYIRHENADLPGGGGDCFHFFWKPSAWNRFALVHRPDICMPGIGWSANGPAETVETELNGQAVRFYAFRFRRGKTHALELWGAWRNGEPVPLEYSAEQVFGTVPPPATLQLEGKRRSATEIVACSVIQDGAEPPREMGLALLRSVFHYSAND